MNKQIRSYFRAGYSGLFLTSYEEGRVEAELKAIADSIEFRLYCWDIKNGLMGPVGQEPVPSFSDTQDPLALLEHMNKLPERSIILAKDFHMFVAEANPMMIRAVKEALSIARTSLRRFVILGCRFSLCPELEKEFTAVEFALPSREELKGVIGTIATSAGLLLNGNTDAIIDAASGMTTMEAADAAALAVIESDPDHKEIAPSIVAREKAGVVRKNGLLEIVDYSQGIASMGGCQNAKDWITKRRLSFSKEAKAFGLPVPRGILLVGPPGAGKTHFCKITANVFNVPLLKLDGGKIFGSLVGESERNLRSVIATAEAVAPCVLLVDEIEKAFSGSKSSGQTDGGTSARVFGTFLQWMNDKTAPVFVVATANDISQLPPEFVRKGRFDELFFVDLPDKDERVDIFRIHIAKKQRDPAAYALESLSDATEGFTGAEIEAVVSEALFSAFDEGTQMTDQHILSAVEATVPLSKTMAQTIESLRAWSVGRARRASLVKKVTVKSGRKLV